MRLESPEVHRSSVPTSPLTSARHGLTGRRDGWGRVGSRRTGNGRTPERAHADVREIYHECESEGELRETAAELAASSEPNVAHRSRQVGNGGHETTSTDGEFDETTSHGDLQCDETDGTSALRYG